MITCGRPVAINIRTPRALAASNAWMVEVGMQWVLKLTSVPSMSKNNALIILSVFINRKDRQILGYF
jgi:hypothetical protein